MNAGSIIVFVLAGLWIIIVILIVQHDKKCANGTCIHLDCHGKRAQAARMSYHLEEDDYYPEDD